MLDKRLKIPIALRVIKGWRQYCLIEILDDEFFS
jgi:hypothetical protein